MDERELSHLWSIDRKLGEILRYLKRELQTDEERREELQQQINAVFAGDCKCRDRSNEMRGT